MNEFDRQFLDTAVRHGFLTEMQAHAAAEAIESMQGRKTIGEILVGMDLLTWGQFKEILKLKKADAAAPPAPPESPAPDAALPETLGLGIKSPLRDAPPPVTEEASGSINIKASDVNSDPDVARSLAASSLPPSVPEPGDPPGAGRPAAIPGRFDGRDVPLTIALSADEVFAATDHVAQSGDTPVDASPASAAPPANAPLPEKGRTSFLSDFLPGSDRGESSKRLDAVASDGNDMGATIQISMDEIHQEHIREEVERIATRRRQPVADSGDSPPAPRPIIRPDSTELPGGGAPKGLLDSDSRTLTPGMRIGPVTLLKKIGEGSMAIVFLAEQTNIKKRVAVKILKPEVALEDVVVERFRREAQSAGQISHPVILQIFDIGSDQGFHFIEMEYIDGETLADKIERDGRLEPSRALEIGRMLADGIRHAHELGIIHRDIKPENVMLSAHGQVKIADFGLAHVNEDVRLTMPGQLLGTPAYMAPEQWNSEAVTPCTDIYSLGALTYTMISGKQPFESRNAGELVRRLFDEGPPKLSKTLPGLPQPVYDLVESMMQVKPEDRPENMAQVLARFDQAIMAVKNWTPPERFGEPAPASDAFAQTLMYDENTPDSGHPISNVIGKSAGSDDAAGVKTGGAAHKRLLTGIIVFLALLVFVAGALAVIASRREWRQTIFPKLGLDPTWVHWGDSGSGDALPETSDGAPADSTGVKVSDGGVGSSADIPNMAASGVPPAGRPAKTGGVSADDIRTTWLAMTTGPDPKTPATPQMICEAIKRERIFEKIDERIATLESGDNASPAEGWRRFKRFLAGFADWNKGQVYLEAARKTPNSDENYQTLAFQAFSTASKELGDTRSFAGRLQAAGVQGFRLDDILQRIGDAMFDAAYLIVWRKHRAVRMACRGAKMKLTDCLVRYSSLFSGTGKTKVLDVFAEFMKNAPKGYKIPEKLKLRMTAKTVQIRSERELISEMAKIEALIDAGKISAAKRRLKAVTTITVDPRVKRLPDFEPPPSNKLYLDACFRDFYVYLQGKTK